MHPSNRQLPLWRVSVGFLALGFIVYLLRNILIPFFVAAALAYLISPLVRRLHDKLHWPRLIIVLLLYFVWLAAAALVIYRYGPLLLGSAQSLLESIPQAASRLLSRLFGAEGIRWMGRTFTAAGVQQLLTARLQEFVGTAEGVLTLAGVSIRIVLGVVLTLVLLFYLLLRERPLSRFLLYLTPPERRARMAVLINQIDHVIGRYVRGLLLIVAYASVSTFLGLDFIFHVPYAAAIALATGILELLPVIGPILSWILATLAALATGGLSKAMLVAAFYGIIRLSLDNFLGPIILGRATMINPVLIIFSFLTGATLFGILGLLMAIPVAATIKLIIDNRNSDRPEA